MLHLVIKKNSFSLKALRISLMFDHFQLFFGKTLGFILKFEV